jgi:hypothetical protein
MQDITSAGLACSTGTQLAPISVAGWLLCTISYLPEGEGDLALVDGHLDLGLIALVVLLNPSGGAPCYAATAAALVFLVRALSAGLGHAQVLVPCTWSSRLAVAAATQLLAACVCLPVEDYG